ncbi:glycosyltransferase [soil metagenome]
MSNRGSQPDVSIIIVNYNVKEFLASCLQSVKKATAYLEAEIFVVDNDSSDGSIPFLKDKFDDTIYIENTENVGFGKANNQAIRQAKGKYTLLLNPDTLLQEDTLETLIRYMDEHEQCGACGCKILNPDGTFAPESRRSIPTLSAAVYKAIGLTAFFPESKHFGAYYQGWKDEDEGGEVPVISGSFMFFRTDVLKQAQGFDERFFMYGEDIDLCYRVTEMGWEIHYVPQTSIIHYKGESTKKNELAYNRVFNEALYKFFEKHFTSRYSRLFKFLIFWAIQLRVIISFFVNNIRSHRHVLSDLLILNVSLIIGMLIRASFDPRGLLSMFNPEFLWLNLLWSVLYLLFAEAFGVLKENTYSIVGSLKAVFFSFLMLVAITFFIRSLAFSRIILAVAFMLGFTFVGLSRFMRVNRIKSAKLSRGKMNPLRMLLVGTEMSTGEMVQKINSKVGWQVEITGMLDPTIQENSDTGVLPENQEAEYISNLKSVIKSTRTDVIIFLMESVTYKQLLNSIQALRQLDVEIKIVPWNMDFILGKADIEYLNTLPVADLEFNYFNPVQKVIKRSFDICTGLTGCIILLPFSWLWITARQSEELEIPVYNGRGMKTITLNRHITFADKIKNRFRICSAILKGKISLIGAPPGLPADLENYRYKTGFTGYVQINRERITDPKEREQFDLHYLQNYSVWLDLDILFKALIREESLTGAFLDWDRP